MAASAAPHGGFPQSDITSRMAVFGRLFSDDVGLPDAGSIGTANELIQVVRSRVPRTTQPGDESPVFEAAAFVGEWVRSRADARWVAEGPFEPHLQLVDGTRSIIYLMPLVSIMRLATTAGYDGLTQILDTVLEDVDEGARAGPLDELRVRPAADAPQVVAWLRANADVPTGTRAALWRRCQTCARQVEDAMTLTDKEGSWEAHAASAAAMLASRPFACGCGGAPGEVSRFLMVRAAEEDTHKVADIYVAGSYTRVACWTLRDDHVEPYDATVLSVEDLAG